MEGDSDGVEFRFGSGPSPNPVSGDAEALSLTDRQRTIFNALGKMDSILAQKYLGSVTVLQNKSNPDRFPQSALSLREIMKKLHNYVAEAPMLDSGFDDHVKSLIKESAKWRAEYADIAVGLEITQELSHFLEKFITFVEHHNSSFPRGHERARTISTGLDPDRARIPNPSMDKNIERFQYCYRKLNDITHDKLGWTPEEFESHQRYLEDFLVDHLAPSAFQNFTQLDLLIAEGEGHDQRSDG